jgi:predicted AAA+ superfamily ATPase
VEEALSDTRVVLVNGARQSGKSTLVSLIGEGHGAAWYSLDDPHTRQAAAEDPVSFVNRDESMIIDEIQRDPELLLSIKSAVDRDGRPGRFLLTGSARILGLRNLPDTLVGRMETIELWPLAQGEIDGAPDGFIDAVFQQRQDFRHHTDLGLRDYAERLVRGGFPEAISRTASRRGRFFDSYVSDLINRDVMRLAELERVTQLTVLTRMLAARSGQLLVPGNLATALEVDRSTVLRHIRLLEEVFLIKRIPAFARNLSARSVKTSKVAFVDSGIAAHLVQADSRSLARQDDMLGPLLEGFVVMELQRQLSWSQERATAYHYRTKDKTEVDLVLENPRRQVVAFEVKAGATVRGDDFKGLRHLSERLGEDFLLGGVFYTGDKTLSFGPRMLAIPIAAIWESAASLEKRGTRSCTSRGLPAPAGESPPLSYRSRCRRSASSTCAISSALTPPTRWSNRSTATDRTCSACAFESRGRPVSTAGRETWNSSLRLRFVVRGTTVMTPYSNSCTASFMAFRLTMSTGRALLASAPRAGSRSAW